MRVGGHRHASVALPPGKPGTHYTGGWCSSVTVPYICIYLLKFCMQFLFFSVLAKRFTYVFFLYLITLIIRDEQK